MATAEAESTVAKATEEVEAVTRAIEAAAVSDTVETGAQELGAPAGAAFREEAVTGKPAVVTQCPKGHALKHAQATAGQCDGCAKPVAEGELVMDCRDCNWYLCTACRPITECPSGHALHSAAAIAGGCNGCKKSVKQGDMVMDCRQCNWYLCLKCQPMTQCPSGHELKRWVTQQAGKCDLCSKPTQQGDMVMDCRRCNWYLCTSCHPQSKGAANCTAAAADAGALPQCAAGHPMQPAVAQAGNCDGCSKKVLAGEMVTDCRQCNYYLCKACQPITMCKKGHRLQSQAARAGACDGCHRPIQSNQNVMECESCNWYLCSMCHMPRNH